MAGWIAALAEVAKFGADIGKGAIQYDQEKALSRDAWNRQLEFWKMQNEYNKPSAQVQRLKDAGLNPALMYGAGSGANTAGELSSVAKGSAPSIGGTFDLLGAMMSKAQIDKTESEVRLNDAEAKRIEGETLDPGFRQQYMQGQLDLWQSQKIETDTKVEWQKFENQLQQKFGEAERSLNYKSMQKEYNLLCARTIEQMNKNSVFGLERQKLENYIALQGEELILRGLEQEALRISNKTAETTYQILKRNSGNLISIVKAQAEKERELAELADNQAEYTKELVDWYGANQTNAIILGYLNALIQGGEIAISAITKTPPNMIRRRR